MKIKNLIINQSNDPGKEKIARGMIDELYAIEEDEGLSDSQKMALDLLRWLFQDHPQPEIDKQID